MAEVHRVNANGASIPAIGLGTFQLTGEACESAVTAALACGYRHIDTARMYGNEEAVGSGLKASGIARDEVFVTTKVWWEDIAPGDLERAAEASLRRLGLSMVDLLLIHWPNPAVPVASSIRALSAAKRAGLARHIGVSNYPSAMLAEAVAASPEQLVCDQVEYHPYLDQTRLREAARTHGMAVTSYSPLGRSGVFQDPTLREIAAAHGRSVAQIVLHWHVQQPGIVAIPKSGTEDRIRENIAVFDFALTPDEMTRISALARPDGRVINPAFAPVWDDAA